MTAGPLCWWPPRATPARQPWRASGTWTAPALLVFYPVDGVSQIQRAADGNPGRAPMWQSRLWKATSTTAQTGVKHHLRQGTAGRNALGEQRMYPHQRQLHQLGTAAASDRLLLQRLCRSGWPSGEIQVGDKLNVCVPTGNFGNILAGYYAKRMGLPIGQADLRIQPQQCPHRISSRTGTYDRNRRIPSHHIPRPWIS